MPRKSETKRALSGTEDGCGGEDGGERDGRCVGGDGAGEGRLRGARREAGLGREDGGERDRRRMGTEDGGEWGWGWAEGRWRGARREADGRGWGAHEW